MTRGGKRGKGPQARGIHVVPSHAAGDGARGEAEGGWSKLVDRPGRRTAACLIGRFFSCPWLFPRAGRETAGRNDRPATASHVPATRSNKPARQPREYFPTASRGRRESPRGMGTVGTMETARPEAHRSAIRAAGGCSHWRSAAVGTVGTGRAGFRGRKLRALVASPARRPAGRGGL